MQYLCAAETADRWGVSLRQVQRLLAAGRIPGAMKFGRSWMIPAQAAKPDDPRRKGGQPRPTLADDLADIVQATFAPMPAHNPDAVIEGVGEDRLRLQYVGELAYLRGDFPRVIRCYRALAGDQAAMLRACPLTIAAAISSGDDALYQEIEAFLQHVVQTTPFPSVRAAAQHGLNTACVSAIAPGMVSGWLRAGDFSALPPAARPSAAYHRAKVFQGLRQYDAMLAVAQTALSLLPPHEGILYAGLYLRVACAAALCGLGRTQEARAALREALQIGIPHGFLTPFAESATAFGGLLEQCLERDFPARAEAVTAQWQRTFPHWMAFHNRFTRAHITDLLTLREYEIASLLVQRVPRGEIAERLHISSGRLNNITQEIYQKLLIDSREALSGYIL